MPFAKFLSGYHIHPLLPFFVLDPSWTMIVLWHLLSSYYFYCTGHQATIPSIRFEAAFVGFPGDMENLFLPGKARSFANRSKFWEQGNEKILGGFLLQELIAGSLLYGEIKASTSSCPKAS